METSNHPRRAANLHAQAAHAYADGKDEQDVLAQARRALSLFIQYQMVQRTPVFYANITRKLTNHGMKNSAEALAKEFGPLVGAMPASARPPHSKAACQPVAQSAEHRCIAVKPTGSMRTRPNANIAVPPFVHLSLFHI